jgi:hypothetical protein
VSDITSNPFKYHRYLDTTFFVLDSNIEKDQKFVGGCTSRQTKWKPSHINFGSASQRKLLTCNLEQIEEQIFEKRVDLLEGRK